MIQGRICSYLSTDSYSPGTKRRLVRQLQRIAEDSCKIVVIQYDGLTALCTFEIRTQFIEYMHTYQFERHQLSYKSTINIKHIA